MESHVIASCGSQGITRVMSIGPLSVLHVSRSRYKDRKFNKSLFLANCVCVCVFGSFLFSIFQG